MRIAVVSDLHYEFGTQRPVTLDRDVDVLVLAGDIDKATNVRNRALEIADGRALNIVHVAGNHEYYGLRMDKADAALSAMEEVHWLNNSSVDLHGFTFIGSTLWTDFALDGNPELTMMHAQNSMNDYRRIKVCAHGVYRKFLPRDARHANLVARQYIFDKLRSLDRSKTIVVTHHGPTHMSVDDRYIGDPLNGCYSNNYGNDVADYGPAYWFHGHTHCDMDYMCGDTRVICNPWGYPGEKNSQIRYLDVN